MASHFAIVKRMADPLKLPPATKAYICKLETHAAADAQRIPERDAKIDELTKRLDALEEQYRLALAQRFAPKSEKRRDRLFNEAEQIAETEPAEEDDDLPVLPDTGLPDTAPVLGKRGRKPLPAHLPRECVEYDLHEDQKTCACCGNSLHRIGEDVSEQLHYEVKVTVLQNARFKYACRHCETHAERTPIVLAPMPAQPLPGSHASAAMIATVTTGKYVDGTPLYRMADVLARSNVPVSRGTLANWIIRPSELHNTRLYDALRKTLLSQPLIHGDETTVQVLKEPGKSAQSKSYMWCYRSAEDCAEPVVLFEYQPGRAQEYPKAFPTIDFLALDPIQQRLRRTADHRRNRFDRRPHRRMFATLLTYQTHCALPDFRGKLGCLLVHGSILSRRIGVWARG